MTKIANLAGAGVLFSLALGLTTNKARCDESSDRARDFNAVQRIYQQGVPQTDRRGQLLAGYDAARSFFPVGLWGQPLGDSYGHHIPSWKELSAAGFNTIWPWHTVTPDEALKEAKAGGVQIVLMDAHDDATLRRIKDDPHLLGNVWMDEPINGLGSADMNKLFADFNAYKAHVKTIAPQLPVFINDSPWISEPATSWWVKWDIASDISVHDNYPILTRAATPRSVGAPPNGIPQTVALAVASNKEAKPVWCVIGAFEQPGTSSAFPFRFPTPMQLRACVYAALIHGATGIMYFMQDSVVSRDGDTIGIAPDPPVAYVPNPKVAGNPNPSPATPVELAASRALWATAVQVNGEIEKLTPALLSPTMNDDLRYEVHITGQAVTDTPIRALLKRHPDGSLWLLTVNLDDAVLNVNYTFSHRLRSAVLQFENQQPETLGTGAKTFTAHYEPFETHVYRLEAGND